MTRTILQQYRDESAFNRDLGDRFERLIRAYLKLDPHYVALFSDVWLWKDWPEREAYGYKAPDTGIDLGTTGTTGDRGQPGGTTG